MDLQADLSTEVQGGTAPPTKLGVPPTTKVTGNLTTALLYSQAYSELPMPFLSPHQTAD